MSDTMTNGVPAAKSGVPAAKETEDARGDAHARQVVRVDAGVADSVDWQRLWLAAQRTAWKTLALIPIGEGLATPRLAAALAEVGRRHLGGTVVALDATKVSLSTLRSELSALTESARCAERAIVALPPLLGSPACLEIARAADAALLCIELGSSAAAEAEQILEEVGRLRVIGSVIVRRRKESR